MSIIVPGRAKPATVIYCARGIVILRTNLTGIPDPRRMRQTVNVRFPPKADIANVNVLSRPPHLGASRAYLEDVPAAKFYKEGGHGTLLVPESVEQFPELWLIQHGIVPRIRGE